MRRWLLLACLVVAGAAWSGAFAAEAPETDLARLGSVLDALDGDPALAGKAGLERFKARQALTRLQTARSRDRAHALALANAWVEAASEAAQAELLAVQSAQLDRERDQIMLEASRLEAERAWKEADRLRLQNLAREEEEQRRSEALEAERLAAEQAELDAAGLQAADVVAGAEAREAELARKAAELSAALAGDDGAVSAPPARKSGKRTIYTLPGTAFASGSAQPTASAQASLQALAGKLGGARSISVQGHTDNQGADAANLALSQKRAEAVRQTLLAAGVPAARVSAAGKGESDPLVANTSAEGRARNRRVEIVVE